MNKPFALAKQQIIENISDVSQISNTFLEFVALGPRLNVSSYPAPRAQCCRFVAVLDKISWAELVVSRPGRRFQ